MSEPSSPQRDKLPSHTLPLADLIEKLQRFLLDQHIEAYLVGGSLRDLLRGQLPQDIDLAIQGEAIPTARKLADALGGFFAPLRQEKKGVARVILPSANHASLIVDIAAVHGGNIIDDLAKRDFTINALALPLQDIPSLSAGLALFARNAQPVLIDPFHGLRDLQHQTLRAVQEGIFHNDPLRLLRAIRIAHRLQFHLAPSTSALLKRDAPLLINAAPERIRDELLQILSVPDGERALQMLDTYHLLPAIFPRLYESGIFTVGAETTKTKKEERWKTVTFLSHLLRAFQGEVVPLSVREQSLVSKCSHIREEPSFQQRWQIARHAYPRAALLTLAALVYDLLTPRMETNSSSTERAHLPSESLITAIRSDLQRLALGRQAADFITFLLSHVHAPWHIAPLPQNGPIRQWRAGRHYFRQFGEQGVDLAVFCLTCHLAWLESLPPDKTGQDHAQILIDLLDAYYHAHDELIPPTLIDGQDMIASLGIPPGPLVGMLVAEVRNAQLDGVIQTREEALTFAKDRAAHSSNREQQK